MVLSFLAVPVFGPNLDELEYHNARDVAFTILREFPPSEYVYVGVGRSPTPVMEMLKHLSGPVHLLPISEMYSRPGFHEDYEAPLSSEVEANLFAHFRRFLPSSRELGGKKILLIDAVQGGGSMVATEEYVTKFLNQERPGQRADVFLMAPEAELPKVKAAQKPYRILSLQPYPALLLNYDISSYDRVAEWYVPEDEAGRFLPPFTAKLARRGPDPGSERGQLLERFARFREDDPVVAAYRKYGPGCRGDLARLPL